jgi:hypothetical protein
MAIEPMMLFEKPHNINPSKSEICVVHLIRKKNGIEPLKKYLESYCKNKVNCKHELLFIFKGFSRQENIEEYYSLLQNFNLAYKSMFFRDFGFDIRPYFKAVHAFEYKYFCFLNSYSYILDENWLDKMYYYISKPDVGLVGATGSYESLYTNHLIDHGIKENTPLYKKIKVHCRRRLTPLRLKFYFDNFPNYHIRTNGFMIARSVMLKIRYGLILSKLDAHKFESGKNSLTRQIMKMNLKALIVGKDGIGYEKEDWYKSNTFRQGNQENLLISDNQTNTYRCADQSAKQKSSLLAWGDKSRVNEKE